MARVAVVTGGARGIGASIAKGLKAAGFNVAVVDVVDEALAAFKAETGIPGYKVDVSSYASVDEGFKQIEKDLGPIDILVNNAGITRDGFLHKMTPDQWNAVINVNLTSVFNTCRQVVPGMRDRGYGRIINISSMNGQKGQFAQTNYSAAKAGILGFTKALAAEGAPKGITVNAVAPGFIETEMTAKMPADVLKAEIAKIPAHRMGKPEEIAAAVVYLASDGAAYVNGATISVNGAAYLV